MEANVYQADGSKTDRSVSLDPDVFDVTPSDHAIWLDVRAIQAAARQGTHKAKERAETAGSTRKLYRQKGTGNARAGSAKSPIRKSGGTIFGPRPRNYTLRINRKTKQLARRSALTYKAHEEALHVVEGLALEAPSTRTIAQLLRAMELEHHKVLLLTSDLDEVLYRSGRNIPKLSVRNASAVSTLDVLSAQAVILQDGALDVLSNLLGKRGTGQQDGDGSTSEAADFPDEPKVKKKTAKAPETSTSIEETTAPYVADADVASEPETTEAPAAKADVADADEKKTSAETQRLDEAETSDEAPGEDDDKPDA